MQREAYPCPIARCDGFVFVRNFGGLKAFGCDGTEQHTDSQVRFSMIAEGDIWATENRAEMHAIERRVDPVGWLQDRLDESQAAPERKFELESLVQSKGLPTYATGFVGRERGALIELRGMTTLSGKASSGKSWFALGAGLNSALDGWDVHYLAAEGEDVIRRRVGMAFGAHPPDGFKLHSVKPGVTVDHMIREIRDWVVTTRTLLIIDSISTLMGLMTVDVRASKWDEQGKLEIFLMRVRELTHGEVAVINISESNAAGETKGRTLDHKSDISINFKSLEDSDAKEVRVVKAWESHTGLIGRVRVNPKGPGLELIYDGPTAYGDNIEEGDGF